MPELAHQSIRTQAPARAAARRARPLLMGSLAGAGLLALLFAVGLRGGGGPGVPGRIADLEWFVVQPQSFDVLILATGEIEPSEKEEIVNRVEEETRIIEIIEEGSMVKAGDVLARLADDKIRQKIEQESLEVEQALAAKVAAEEQLAVAESAAVSEVRSAQLKLELAELELGKWKNGTDKLKMQELTLAVEKAKRELERASREAEQSAQLHAEKFISLSELEEAEIKKIEAENDLATAELQMQTYLKYTQANELRKCTSDVEEAQAELDRKMRKTASDVAEKKAAVQSRIKSLKIRQDRLAQLQQQLEATVITAPRDGVVVYGTSVGGRWFEDDPLRQGRQVRYNESLFIMPDMRRITASLRVHEAVVPRVKIGQSVSVSIDARPGQIVQGTVSQVAIMAASSNWMSDVREYTVKVELPAGFDPTLKPGMRCSGEIHTDRVVDALAVPLQAVASEGSEHFCYVAAGAGVRRQPVKLGRSSETLVEILEGLTAGDRVLLRSVKPGEVLP